MKFIGQDCVGFRCEMSILLGIDASRNRSGGAIANLVGIIRNGDPVSHGIKEIHVWAYRKLLNALPNRYWLVKHNPPELESSLLRQVWWQRHGLLREVQKAKCDILYSTDAASICRFRPMVVMSQDMLSYEPRIMRQFGYGLKRLRLLTILVLQNLAFRHSDGVIFLTRYAADTIQSCCGVLSRVALIPHGVEKRFKQVGKNYKWPDSERRVIRCIYVSPVWRFKHQWVVVCAIALLRQRGHNVELVLVGKGAGKPHRMLEKQIGFSDPEGDFIQQLGFVPHEKLHEYLARAHIFVFASSCENMPVSLIEAMAVGMPIACSDRGPMPEVLKNGGVFFNPEDAGSIADAIERIIENSELRSLISRRAKDLAEQYSWSRCAEETWSFIADTYEKFKENNK